MARIQAIKGMHALLPEQTVLWRHVEQTLADVLAGYGYREIRFPILELTELFSRSIGEVTDIVEKEMYTFADRNEVSVTLRPEGTAGCVRAAEEHGLLYNQVQRLWYAGPMFRYENPQKGRQRQFHQLGAEAFGMTAPEADAEMIAMSARAWRALGVHEHVRLELNTIGSVESRARYREALVEYLDPFRDRLDADSRRRLDSNPLRILDSKVPETQALLKEAPALADCLDAESREHFEVLKALLDRAGIAYTVNSRLVRGLDYYNRTVFEWVTTQLGAQGTVCAGGRYDGLVAQLGGRDTPAVGFAIGLERLVLLLSAVGDRAVLPPSVDVYCVAVGETAVRVGFALTECLRDALPDRVIQMHGGGGSFKSQMKRADKSGARVAIILGEDELRDNAVTVKWLRREAAQERVAQSDLPARLSEALASR